MTGPGGAGGDARLGDLYQEVILDHNRRPKNYGKIEHPTSFAHGVNPLCGDDYYVYLKRDAKGVIQKIGFEGSGCAISKASASMMTAAIEGNGSDQARKLKDAFIHLLTRENVSTQEREAVGKLKLFEGVRNYPIRVKCATLAWRALEEALKENAQTEKQVTTEE